MSKLIPSSFGHKSNKKIGKITKGPHFGGEQSTLPRPQAYVPKEHFHNCEWIFKVGDADDHPSVPHAHSKDEGYRLNAWTGEIYPAGKEREKYIEKLSSKELSRLNKDPGFRKFAKKQIEWYHDAFPFIDFYVPEWFVNEVMNEKKLAIKKEEDTPDVYIFISNPRRTRERVLLRIGRR